MTTASRSMKAWWQRWVAARAAPSAAASPPAATPEQAAAAPGNTPPAAPDAAVLLAGQAGADLAFVAWLLQQPAEPQAPLDAGVQRVLQRLAERAAGTQPDAGLLPRTAGVVPQVLARLRGPHWSLPDLAHHVSRDVTLVAETLALANGALYRQGQTVVDLAQAIRVLGADGLRRAVARVVFRPVVEARGGELVARTAGRLWEHTDGKAQLCAALAQDGGLDAFDAYLLALVHSAAWGAVLRALDAAQAGPALRPGPALAAALVAARDSLCLPVARHWQLPPALVQPAAEVSRQGLRPDASAPVRQLYAGDRLATLLGTLGPPPPAAQAPAPAAATALLAAAGPATGACWRALAAAQESAPDPARRP